MKTAEKDCTEEGVPHVGRLIYMLSHQLKRQNLMPGSSTYGLTVTQRQVLRFILMESIHRDVYQKDIEKEFHVRRSTATGMLQLMEKNGFIYRQNVKQDARLKKIVPTKKAEEIRVEILENISQMEKKLSNGISDEDFRQCIQVLKQMLYNLSEDDPDYKKMMKKQGGLQENDESKII